MFDQEEYIVNGDGDGSDEESEQGHGIGLEQLMKVEGSVSNNCESDNNPRFRNNLPNKSTLRSAVAASSSSVTCLVCANGISESEFESEELFPGASTNALVCALSTIFDIPPSFYDQLNLHSLPTPLYCSICSSLIFNSLEILNSIQSLQRNLDVLKSELKTNLIRSYDDHDDDPKVGNSSSKPNTDSNTDGAVAKDIIRQTLIQSWTGEETNFGDGAVGSEETPDSLLGLEQDSVSHMYTAEEVSESEDDRDFENGNEITDYTEFDDGTETEQPHGFTISGSHSQAQSGIHRQLNDIFPMTTISEVDDEGRDVLIQDRKDVKLVPNIKAKPRQRGRVKGFLRIRKHRQNGRFPYKCGLCGKGYKKQRSFQLHILCHREESKVERIDKHAMLPEIIQSQSNIYDTTVSAVEDDDENDESFQVDCDPTALMDNDNNNDLDQADEEASSSSMTSKFSMPNFPGIEISPAIIKVESQSQALEASNSRLSSSRVGQGRFRPGGILKIRRHRQYRDSAYTCNFCGKAYSNYKSFVRHVKCHRGAGAVNVDLQEDLDEAYKDRYRGIFRLSGRQRKGKFRYRCARCGKGYRNAKSFEIHVQCHSGEYGAAVEANPGAMTAMVKTDPSPNPVISRTWTATSGVHNSSPPRSSHTHTSVNRASASLRLKALSNNSKKLAASYKRQFRGVFRIRSRNLGRSFAYKCTICGKGYQIARSFEKHLKFHTGELTVDDTKPVKKAEQSRSVESENILSIDTLNDSFKFVNDLMTDVIHPNFSSTSELDANFESPSLSTSSSTVTSSAHNLRQQGKNILLNEDSANSRSTEDQLKPQRGRPRAPGTKRRYRGIFRIRNYGRVGNFPYRCTVCGKGYKNVKSYNTHVVFHDEHPEVAVDEAIDDDFDEESPPVDGNSQFPFVDEEIQKPTLKNNNLRLSNRASSSRAETSSTSTFLQTQRAPSLQLQHHCDLCDKNFSSAQRLKAHNSYAHTTNYEFHCEKCDLGLSSRPALYQHMQGHLQERQEEKTFKSFFQRNNATSPVRRNSQNNDLRYSCSICGERFPQYINLKEHSAVHEV